MAYNKEKRKARDELIKKTLMEGPLADRVNSKGNLKGTHENNKKASQKNIKKAWMGRYENTKVDVKVLQHEVQTCKKDGKDGTKYCKVIEDRLSKKKASLKKWEDKLKAEGLI